MTFSKEEIKIIEKLKDAKYAQPFFLTDSHRPSAYYVLKKVGANNCLVLSQHGWVGTTCFSGSLTYIIKPDFVPEVEPEYIDIPIENDGNWLGCRIRTRDSEEMNFLPYYFTHLYYLVSLPGFVGFYVDGIPTHITVVATQLYNNKKVFARFRLERKKNEESTNTHIVPADE